MDFKNYSCIDNEVRVKGVKNFSLPHIFENGQCFRWERKEDSYIIVALNRVIELKKDGDDLIIYNSNIEDFENLWINYFDFERDYSEIKNTLIKYDHLADAINFGSGLRILNQNPLEMLISFIISSNNRIPMIKRAINTISQRFGEVLEYKGEKHYLFPTIDKLFKITQQEFRDCSVGFRDKYLYNTLNSFSSYNDLLNIAMLEDDECHKELQKFSGVGSKVADCIMLFSMGKYSAFPVDVWVKRAMMKFYVAPDTSLKNIRNFGRELFCDLSGFAQQYLFYYVRENNIKI